MVTFMFMNNGQIKESYYAVLRVF